MSADASVIGGGREAGRERQEADPATTAAQENKAGRDRADPGVSATESTPAGNARTLYPPRIMSGFQPTTTVHLGHYFGALKHHIQLHHEYPGECFFMIADYHSMTRGIDPERTRQGTLESATVYLALGLDPSKAVLFRQSDVPKVTELAWIFGCLTPLNWLTANQVYKAAQEKPPAAGAKEQVNRSGLLFYPVLMAADILSLRATVVPVGHDQQINVEMVRDIAKAFNAAFDQEVFPIPRALHLQASVVKGIHGEKMLVESDNFIPLFGRFDQIRDRVAKIRTDSTPEHERKDPDKCRVFHLYSLVAPEDKVRDMRSRYLLKGTGSIGYQEAKNALIQECQECFSPFEDRYQELKRDPDTVSDILRTGFMTAREEVEQTLDVIRSLIGLGY